MIGGEQTGIEPPVMAEWTGVCGLDEIPRQGSRVVEPVSYTHLTLPTNREV